MKAMLKVIKKVEKFYHSLYQGDNLPLNRTIATAAAHVNVLNSDPRRLSSWVSLMTLAIHGATKAGFTEDEVADYIRWALNGYK